MKRQLALRIYNSLDLELTALDDVIGVDLSPSGDVYVCERKGDNTQWYRITVTAVDHDARGPR